MESHPPLDEVENAAAAWLLKQENPGWSAADDARLQAWLQGSPSHQVAYIRLRSVWNKTGRLNSVGSAFTGADVPARGDIKRLPFFALKNGHAPARPRGSSARVRYAIAATVVLASLLVSIQWWLNRDEAFQTPIGGLTSVPMKDGSRVTLNTASRLSIHLDDAIRSVDLASGEAFFDVAKDATRPFVVIAGNKRIVAVGTQFSVRTTDDGVRVAVTEGLVRVEEGTSGAHRTLTHLPAGYVATLAQAADKPVEVRQQPLEAVERSLAWRSGFITLRSTPLRDAIAEFNRYNTHQLVIADPALDEIQVGGSFKANNIQGFVRLLQEGFRVQASEQGDQTLLTRDSHAR